MDARTEYITVQELLDAPNLVLENQNQILSTHNATALCEAAFEHLPIAPVLLKIEPKTGKMYCTDIRIRELKTIMVGNAQFSKSFIYDYLNNKHFSELLRSIQHLLKKNLINYQYTYLTKDKEVEL